MLAERVATPSPPPPQTAHALFLQACPPVLLELLGQGLVAVRVELPDQPVILLGFQRTDPQTLKYVVTSCEQQCPAVVVAGATGLKPNWPGQPWHRGVGPAPATYVMQFEEILAAIAPRISVMTKIAGPLGAGYRGHANTTS